MTYQKLLLGKIDYINAFPVYYGLDQGLLPDWIEMIPSPPSVLNNLILKNEIDMGPVSAAFYGMNHRDLLVLPDLSISSHGEVMSVVLMSGLPLDRLDGKKIVLSRDSATSVCLVKLLMARRGIEPDYVTARLKSIEDVPGDASAAMVIGDAAMTRNWEARFQYRFDLGQIWHDMTSLPFVYALWVVRRAYARKNPDRVKDALELLYESRRTGYDHIEAVIQAGALKLGLEKSYVKRYFQGLICNLDKPEIAGLTLFFDRLYHHGIFKEKVDIQFFPGVRGKNYKRKGASRSTPPSPGIES